MPKNWIPILIVSLVALPCMLAFTSLRQYSHHGSSSRGSLAGIRKRLTTAASSSASAAGGSDQSTSAPPRVSAQAEASFARVFGGTDKRPVVLFDGVCNFCNRGIDAVLRLDLNRQLRFAPLQSGLGRHLMEACGRNPDDLSSMLLVEATRKLSLKSDAAVRIAEIASPSPLLGSALEKSVSMLFPQTVRDGAYDIVATNRYSILGKREVCRMPDPGDDRFLA